LKALAEFSGLSKDKISSYALSFIFAPAINAAGRMGEAFPALEMLLEKDLERAAALSEKLYQINQQRRATERKILDEAEVAAQEQLEKPGRGIITLAAENWHHGVIGIVASRLVDKFCRPVALIALDGDVGRGSARSVAGFDITSALSASSGLLTRFGGHEQAAGFTIPRENCNLLCESLNHYAITVIKDEKMQPALNIEAELNEEEISFELADLMEQMEPFGPANPSPLLGSRGWELVSWRLVGADKKHLKLNVKKGSWTLAPIFFSAADIEAKLEPERTIDLAFKLKTGFFRNKKTLEVETKDIRFCDEDEYGRFSVVDKRGVANRIGILQKLINDHGQGTAIFYSTLSSRNSVEKKCRSVENCHGITSGSLNGTLKMPDDIEKVILYELPLTGELLIPIMKAVRKAGRATVYLLFNEQDKVINRSILDHALPGSDSLRKVVQFLLDEKKTTISEKDRVKVEEIIGFKPAGTFWQRVEAVITEAGIITKIKAETSPGQLYQSWSSILAESSTFLDMEKRRAACEEFQMMLLESSSAELSKYFKSLA